MRVGLERAAVDRGAGADLHVVADLDVAELRHLDVPAVLHAVAEAVGADHGVGVDDDPVAEDGVVVQDRVAGAASRRRRGGSCRPTTAPLWTPATGADDAALADAGEREDAGVRADAGRRVDERPRIDAVRRRLGLAVQFLHDSHEGRQGRP